MATVAQLIVQIDASTASLTRELQKANGDLNKFAATTDANVKGVSSKFSAMGASVVRTLGAMGVAYGAKELVTGFMKQADAFTTIQNRLQSVTGSAAELKQVYDGLFASAQANSVEIMTGVELYTRMSRALESTGMSTERLIEMTDTLGKVTQLSGATSAEASSAMLQLSQSFNEGKMAGEEYNAVVTAMPMLIDAMAQELAKVKGITFEEARAGMKEFASEGEITRDIMVAAIEGMRAQTVEAMGGMADTSEKSFTRMWNSVTSLVGAIEGAFGFVKGLTVLVGGLTRSLSEGAAMLEKYAGSIKKVMSGEAAIAGAQKLTAPVHAALKAAPQDIMKPEPIAKIDWTAAQVKPVHKATGGMIGGPGTDTSDNLLALLSPGEYVVDAKTTRKYQKLLESLPKFASGGLVSSGVDIEAAMRQISFSKSGQYAIGSPKTDAAAQQKIASTVTRGHAGIRKTTDQSPIKEAAQDTEDFGAVIQEITADFQKAEQIFDSTRTPLEKYSAEQANLNRLMNEGFISADTHKRGMDALSTSFDSISEQSKLASEHMQNLSNMSSQMGMSIALAFEDAVLSGEKFSDILASLWQDIQRIVMRNLVTIPLASALTSVIGGMTMGIAGGGMAGGAAGFAKGGWVSGSGTDDSILSLLTPGEFVVPAAVAKRNRGLLEGLPRFAEGGWAGMAPGGAANNNSAPRIEVILENKSGTPLKSEKSSQSRGPDGSHMIKVMVVSAVNDALRGGDFDRNMGARYGASVQPIAR